MVTGKRKSVNFVLLSASVIIGTACTSGTPSSEPDSVGPGTRSTAIMTRDVASMSGAALWAYANDTIWSDSTEADRLCEGAVNCTKATDTKKVRVRIWAHKDAKDIHDSAVGPFGALVAKLENIGDAKERMYGLERDNVYLLFLHKGDDTSGRYRLVEVSSAGKHEVRVVQEGTQIRCNHPQKWPESWATFVDCSHGPPTPPPYVSGSTGLGLVKTVYAATLATHVDDPAWITCPSGCCTSGAGQIVQLE